MIWDEIITFSDHNISYRFRIHSIILPNSGQCRITVDELNEMDVKTGEFSFIYDIKQQMPQADFELHNKPIQAIVTQMLDIRPNVETWGSAHHV